MRGLVPKFIMLICLLHIYRPFDPCEWYRILARDAIWDTWFVLLSGVRLTGSALSANKEVRLLSTKPCLSRILHSYGVRRKITFAFSVSSNYKTVCSGLNCLSWVTVHRFVRSYQFSRLQHIFSIWRQPPMYIQYNSACQSKSNSWSQKPFYLGSHAGLWGGFFGNTCRVSVSSVKA